LEPDRERIENYLHEIATEVSDLEKVLKAGDREILSDRILLKSLKYSVIVIAEAVAGALQHILAKSHNVSIEGYADALSKSGQFGVISDSLLARLRPFIGFRNMLVHQYWRVSDGVFVENLRKGLDDFRAFVEEIQGKI
jgi:uncharacterized protein YutE (UPF0331/DUF86 family)